MNSSEGKREGGGFGGFDEVPELSHSMELVRRVHGGEREALEELLARYTPRLTRIVQVQLGPGLRRWIEADDIVQEVLLVAFQKIGELEPRGHASILQWLTRIAENVIRSKAEYFAAQKRDPRREVRYHEGTRTVGSPGALPARETSPSQRALHEEFQALVDAYVAELTPPDYRAVILLRDYQECSWEEVRRELGRPTVEAAQELYRRAHLRLRERMRRHLERPGEE